MKNKILSVLFCICTVFSMINVTAAGDLLVRYDSVTKKLEIEGSIGENYGMVTITVLPKDMKKADITEKIINDNKYPITVTRSDADGNIKTDFILPDYLKSNEYTVYADCGEKGNYGSFIHMNDDEARGVTEKLNDAGKDEFVKIFSENLIVLGIESATYTEYAESVNDYLFENRPANGYSVSELSDEIRRCIAINLIYDDKTDEAILKYSKNFDVTEAEYNSLSSEEKADFISEVKKKSLKEEKAYDIFMEAYIFARTKNAENYSAFKDIILSYSVYLKLDTVNTNYDNPQVFSKIFDLNPQSLDAILTALNEYMNEPSGGGGSGSSGGSGGGGGASGSYSIGAVSKPQLQADKFYDIASHWGRDAINTLAQKGIFNGFPNGNFMPDNKVSRAEFIKILMVAINAPEGKIEIVFDDVTESDWFCGYVSAAKEMGIAEGFDNKFNPNSEISRQDAAVLLMRVMKTKSILFNGEKTFDDEGDIADYAKESVKSLAAVGIIEGVGGNFLPKNSLTRAEAATLIFRMLNYIDEV